jgi:membrane complex biogenesis BtpA family protein
MLSEIFKKPKPIIGKLQLLALPGAPGWEGQWDVLITRAEQEATALATGGVDGLIIENFHDTPYTTERMDPAGAIAMAMLTRRIKQFTSLPIGISVLQNDPETALAVALNTQADFIRISVLTGALVTESGVINNRYNQLLHYKSLLQTKLPPILANLSLNHLGPKQHHQQNSLIHLRETARSLQHQHSQNLAIVIPDSDLEPTDLQSLREAVPNTPLLIESQTPNKPVDPYYAQADGLILDAGTRKNSSLQPSMPPTIDMARVEEVINRLRNVVPVSEMDPDIFLRR